MVIGRFLALLAVTVSVVACGSPAPTTAPPSDPDRSARQQPPTVQSSHSQPSPATSSTTELNVPWKALIAKSKGVPEQDLENPAMTSMEDLAVITPQDAWAVGSWIPSDSRQRAIDYSRPAIMHWDGRSWHDIAPPAGIETPKIVSASSSDNVWVMGKYGGIHRWDGRAWTDMGTPHITDPTIKTRAIKLGTAVVTGPQDAWVAGVAFLDEELESSRHPFLVRRSASGWSQVAPPGGMYILDIAALSPEDVWVLGDVDEQPVIAHWDGREWRITPHPAVSLKQYGGAHLDAVSPDEVWVTVDRPLAVMRWNGKRWNTLPSPPTEMQACQTAGDGQGRMWILAQKYTPVQLRVRRESPVLLHYDGRSWSAKKPPRTITECDGILMRVSETGRLTWAADFTGQ